jgi:N-acetyl-gamma-glutamyl-phosphate reductase
MIGVGIVGGAGYTAGELLRLLVHHEQVEVMFVYSTSQSGKPLYAAHPDLRGTTVMKFSQRVDEKVDVVFLCLGHGNSKEFLKNHSFSEGTRIIDLSNDFRLKKDSNFQGRDYVYGLTELNRRMIPNAMGVANPGCFATLIELTLLPLAQEKLLQTDVHINATTGSTGAGVTPTQTTHFSWRDNNFSVYKAFTHQHLEEIEESLRQVQPDIEGDILFIPNRGNFSRGIFASIYLKCERPLAQLNDLYATYYEASPFTHLSLEPIHLKQVINTNNVVLHLAKHGDHLLITGAIDNLLKGASGQAVENMNLMMGLDQSTGLKLKGSSF